MSYSKSSRPFRIATVIVACLLLYLVQSAWRSESTGDGVATALMGKDTKPVSGKASGPRIAIVTFITDQKSYIHMSLKNKHGELAQAPSRQRTCLIAVRLAYARKHGYDLIIDYEGKEGIPGLMWHKFVMIERLIRARQHDWIWWVDFDTLITNGNIKLVDIIRDSLTNVTAPNDIDLLLTADW